MKAARGETFVTGSFDRYASLLFGSAQIPRAWRADTWLAYALFPIVPEVLSSPLH